MNLSGAPWISALASVAQTNRTDNILDKNHVHVVSNHLVSYGSSILLELLFFIYFPVLNQQNMNQEVKQDIEMELKKFSEHKKQIE